MPHRRGPVQLRARPRCAGRCTAGRAPRASRRRPVGARDGSWPTAASAAPLAASARGRAAAGPIRRTVGTSPASPRRATRSSGLAPTSAVAGVTPPAAVRSTRNVLARGSLATSRCSTIVRASSGPSAASRSARASTTLCRPLPGRAVASVRWRCGPRCSSGGRHRLGDPHRREASRTGHAGRASVNCTDCGRISAAGLDMSKGKAPKMIGVLCEARAARASAIRGKAVCTPSATTTPSRAGEDERRFAGHAAAGLGWPVSPSALIWRTPCSKPHTAIDAASHREPDAFVDRLLDPAGEHRAGEVAVPDEERRRATPCGRSASAMARSARSLTCCGGLTAGASVRPHQPVGHRLADLRGGQALVVAVIPFGDQRRHLVDGEAGQFGGDQRALAAGC